MRFKCFVSKILFLLSYLPPCGDSEKSPFIYQQISFLVLSWGWFVNDVKTSNNFTFKESFATSSATSERPRLIYRLLNRSSH